MRAVPVATPGETPMPFHEPDSEAEGDGCAEMASFPSGAGSALRENQCSCGFELFNERWSLAMRRQVPELHRNHRYELAVLSSKVQTDPLQRQAAGSESQ